MKKGKLMAIAAAALATIGGSSSVVNTQVSQETTAKQYEPQQPVKQNTPAVVKQVKEGITTVSRYRPYNGSYRSAYSRSPKEWGQYLQATGRQKWVKSKRA